MRGYPYGYEIDQLGEPVRLARPPISGLQDAEVAPPLSPLTEQEPLLAHEELLEPEDMEGYAAYLAMGGAEDLGAAAH